MKTTKTITVTKTITETSTTKWLDKAKEHLGLSDYALAPLIGVSKSQMSRYRTGLDFLSDDAAIKLAELLGMDSPAQIIASAHAERAKSAEVREFWSAWAERLGGIAAGVFLAVGMTVSPPAPAAPVAQSANGGMYIMLN